MTNTIKIQSHPGPIVSCFMVSLSVLPRMRSAVAIGIFIYFGCSGPLRDIPVAFVIRRGGALWRISVMLRQLIFSMRSGMFFLFQCNSNYVV